jgi:large subunit ribosomal protein L22
MISKATCRFIRISPRKTRLAADMVRGKSIDEANSILSNLEVRPRLYLRQVLNSAVANATSADPDISASDLYVSKITIDGGPMFKRYRAGSMGRAMMIKHRTSHISIELDRKKESVAQAETRNQKLRTKNKKAEGKREEKEVRHKVKKMAAARKGK